MEIGLEMKVRIEERMQKAGLQITDENIRKIIFWNRKEKREHSSDEIRAYLNNEQ